MSQLRSFFKTVALRPEYQGEDRKLGMWCAGEPKARDQFASEEEYQEYLRKREALAESDRRVTKYFNEEESKDSEVHFDEQGRAVGKTVKNADGTVSGADGVMSGGKVEYVMDKAGTMHQFNQRTVPTGESMVHPGTGRRVDKDKVTHHSSIMAGKEVAAAGELELDDQGRVTKIDNKSGHYKPGATQVIQMLEELARQGALLDQTYVMPGPDGKPKELEGKLKQIHDAVVKVQAGLKKKLADGKKVDADLAAIKKAKGTLAKLGAAPANKFRPVEVEFIEGAENKKGAEIKQATGTTSKAQDFLQTGGGNQKQANAKGKVLAALKEKVAEKAKKLDAQAELPPELRARIEKALKSKDTSDQALDQILRDLEAQLPEDAPAPLPAPPVAGHAAPQRQAGHYSQLDDTVLKRERPQYSNPDDAVPQGQAEHYSQLDDTVLKRETPQYSTLDDALPQGQGQDEDDDE